MPQVINDTGINLFMRDSQCERCQSAFLRKFEKAYTAPRLGNWEIPRWFPSRPRQLKGSTKIIADDAGHLLPGVKRDKNPFGAFRGTYLFPDRLTRKFVDDYHECLVKSHKWSKSTQAQDLEKQKICHKGTTPKKAMPPPCCPTKCETAQRVLSFVKDTNRYINKCGLTRRKKSLDLEYIPGDLTPYHQQHPSRQLLLEQKYERDNNIETELPLGKLRLGNHECKLESSTLEEPKVSYTPVCLPTTQTLTPIPTSPSLPLKNPSSLNKELIPPIIPLNDPLLLTKGLTPPITPPPFSQQDNKNGKGNRMQFTAQGSITGKPNERSPSPIVPAYANFELAKRMHHDNLQHQPLPDCVADLAYQKLQLTGTSSENVLDLDPIATGMGVRSHGLGPTQCTKLKVYRPKTCAGTPKPLSSNEICRPFSSTLPTKRVGAMDLAICWDYRPPDPADEPQPTQHIDGSNGSAGPAVFNYVKTPRDDGTKVETGRSAGVFDNTSGQPGFFDKDIKHNKTDFTGRPIERDSLELESGLDAYISAPQARAFSASRNYSSNGMLDKHKKLSQSSPNLAKQDEIKALRRKYLAGENSRTGCKRGNPGFFKRTCSRLCHKIAPEPLPPCCLQPPRKTFLPCSKAAFRAGLPKYNARGDFITSDNTGCCHSNRVLVVPRPGNPYVKRNYDIDTLVPPFRSQAGGAGQGGYPEHWRLSSVYQQAFKPLSQRRRPLLQTVFK